MFKADTTGVNCKNASFFVSRKESYFIKETLRRMVYPHGMFLRKTFASLLYLEM